MKKQEFDTLLKDIGLSRKEFAELTGVQYTTVGKWNDDDRPIPSWVDSWIENYRERKKLEELQKILGGEK